MAWWAWWSSKKYFFRDDTQIRLLKEILDQIKPDSKVAILAAPTLYCRLFKENPKLAKNIYIFEYDKESVTWSNLYSEKRPQDLPCKTFDPFGLGLILTRWVIQPKRFSVYDNFIYYDINDPLGNDVKKLKQNSFDYILADPPFWLEEVLLKLFQTIDYLKTHNGKTMICAGPPMTSFLVSLVISSTDTLFMRWTVMDVTLGGAVGGWFEALYHF